MSHHRGPWRAGLLVLAGIALAPPPTRALTDGSPLSLDDLATYRDALEAPGDAPAAPVTFRDLWDEPERFVGRRVTVEGRVVRRFRQPALGAFPPLVELWAVNPQGDPFCLVFAEPTAGQRPPVNLGTTVRFSGTFLKRLRYEAADVPRLAPLIVGDRPPVVLSRTRDVFPAWGHSALDWLVGLALAAVVVFALLRAHVSRPVHRRRWETGPTPEFLPPTAPPVDHQSVQCNGDPSDSRPTEADGPRGA